ncbi:hypothetical protein TNCV_2685221 [Trichonephila clavipes]|nr:hypothetical protein TNCV_2685221 [Trichonephila clavipes]
MRPERAPTTPNHRTNGRTLSLNRFNVYRPFLHGRSSVTLGSNSFHSDHELMTKTTRAGVVNLYGSTVWTLVPVRLGKQLSGNSTVDEIASEAADCRLIYTMANCPQRRLEKKEGERKKKKKELEKTRTGRFRKRRGESGSFLFRDADQGSKTRIRKNALRTGRRQAVERATSKRGYHTG